MPLKIVETSLENVKPEHHALYVKNRDGRYQLDLHDLNSHVDAQVLKLKSELELSRESERRMALEFGFGDALRRANLLPNYEELAVANFGARIAIETVDNRRQIRIKDGNGGMPMLGTGAGGVATLDDLVKEVAAEYPSIFKSGSGTPPKDATGGSGDTKTITRGDFDALSPVDQRQKVLIEKYKVVDGPATTDLKGQRRDAGGKVLTRAEFNALSPADQRQKVTVEKYKIVD